MGKFTSKAPRTAVVVFSYYLRDPRVRRAAEALSDSGMSTDVICLRNNSEPRKEIVNGVKIYRVPLQRKRAGKLRYLWEYTFFILMSFFTLSVLHIRKNYNLIHVHNLPDILILCALIPRLCGSKVILDLHDPMPEVYMTKYSIDLSHPIIRLLIFLEKLSISFSSLVITPNIAFRDLFISRGCPESKIQIVMNSPHHKIFSYPPRINKNENVNTDHFTLMYHGIIAERNGLDIALETLREIHKKIPKTVLHVYGDGDFVESFLKLKGQLELDDIVFYHGEVPNETIAKVIESIDIGLIPNKLSPFTDINMPTRIFEYLSKGKPVIAPRTRGILDYFDEESLYLFEPGNAESLAEVILEIYNNPERCYEVLERGIEVYKNYRWELQSKHFLKQVKNLLSNNDSQSKMKKIVSPIEHKFPSIKKIYYKLKPIIPRWLQIILRRAIINLNKDKYKDIWPIYSEASYAPDGWIGWPNNKQFALVLTHDVETLRGEERCLDLMNLEKELGFRSAYFFIPEKCKNCSPLHHELKSNEFEVGVHGLIHDGKLFQSRHIFQKRAARINHFLYKWEALGFRSPSMHHELTWINDLDILYDASTYDVDPFELQPAGVGTIFPFIVKNEHSRKSYVELPYTLPQDFALFILMRQKNIDIWKRKLDWIAENGGMALVITHPDYMNIGGRKLSIEEYPVDYYLDFLSYIENRYENQYWHALPKEITQFWARHMKNTLDDKRRTFLNEIDNFYAD